MTQYSTANTVNELLLNFTALFFNLCVMDMDGFCCGLFVVFVPVCSFRGALERLGVSFHVAGAHAFHTPAARWFNQRQFKSPCSARCQIILSTRCGAWSTSLVHFCLSFSCFMCFVFFFFSSTSPINKPLDPAPCHTANQPPAPLPPACSNTRAFCV